MRQQLTAKIPILLVLFGISPLATAEPIACLPGQAGCGEPSIEKKVKISFENALNVFVGRLEAVNDSRARFAGTRVFTFRIEQQFKGAIAGTLAHISDTSYVTGGQQADGVARHSLAEFEQLEASAELQYTEDARNRYYQRVTELRDEIKKVGASDPTPTYVVRLNLSHGDRFMRTTDIPMRVGERYAVFVFTRIALAPDPEHDTSNVITIASDPVDLYPLNGRRGKRALSALEQASRPKRD